MVASFPRPLSPFPHPPSLALIVLPTLASLFPPFSLECHQLPWQTSAHQQESDTAQYSTTCLLVGQFITEKLQIDVYA